MKFLTFNYSNAFQKKWKMLGLSSEDQIEMERQLRTFEENRKAHIGKRFLGDMVSGTGGAIKWRFSGKSRVRGKSGSERVIYFFLSGRNYYFVDVYGKSEKANLTAKEKKSLAALSKVLKKISEEE